MDNPNHPIETKSASASAKINLEYLPAYASFLLKNSLEEFSIETIKVSRKENIPLLRYFASYTEQDLIGLSLKSNTELLKLLSENKANEYLDKSAASFVTNQLPIIDRQEVLVEDIAIISLVRRKVFRNFLNRFTSDVILFSNIMEDVDRFITASEAASFNAYNKIQQEKINKINQELAVQHQTLLEAQSFAEMGSFFWDMKYGNSSYTPGAQSIFGLTKPTNLASFFENVLPDDRTKIKLAIDKAFNEDGLYECEYTYIKDNIEKRIWSRGMVQVEEGIPIGMRGTVMDITNKYKLLERLQLSEELHEKAQALTHLGTWSWDIPENKITWSNEMYRMYGLEPQSESITFERFLSFIHPDDRENRLNEIQQSLVTLKAVDYFLRIIISDGTTKMLKGKGEVITDQDNKPIKINGTCQDVTNEYLLNVELREKEQNFQQLINNAPDAIIVINTDSLITLWNPKATDIFGWTSAEVLGRPLTETIIPARYKEAHEQGMKRLMNTGVATILNKTLELSACKKNHQEFYISLTISQTTQGGKAAFIAFIRDISTQKNTQLELEKKTTLVEYKNLELERINAELESFNFAASHDLQEPLRKIQTYSSRIIETSKNILQPQVISDFNKIMTASARMQNLIEDLLHFSQNTLKSQEAELVDLNALIEEVKTSFISNIEEKNVQIMVEQLPLVKVVSFQFLQLFINLFSNAIKYQRQNVSPQITITSAIIPGRKIDIRGVFPDINYLRISIADNGIGFEQEYGEKIFDLFTRLHNKETYSGTGIGLTTCKKIIHNHDGFIKGESVLGRGATFFIYLPEEYIIQSSDR